VERSLRRPKLSTRMFSAWKKKKKYVTHFRKVRVIHKLKNYKPKLPY